MDNDEENRRQQILIRRAEELSKPIDRETTQHHYIEILVFGLAQELYGIETKYLKEVYPLKDYTPLPCTPPFIYGLINIRRKILSVIDLRVIFSLPVDTQGDYKAIVLVDGPRSFAIISEEVHAVQKVAVDLIQTTLPTLTGMRQDFLLGITPEDIIILDGNKLLTSRQLVIDEKVEAL